MTKWLTAAVLATCLSPVLAQDLQRGDGEGQIEVTITNITRGSVFTPFLIVNHTNRVALFEPGAAASPGLAALAEGGDISLLMSELDGLPDIGDIGDSGGLLEPGQSVTVLLDASDGFDRISLAAMVLPTNDSFAGLDSARVPRGADTRAYKATAWDAGSEPNDELCASIPGGADCAGEGLSDGDGEGFVHVSAGIHGIGDLAASGYDWRNPVARVEPPGTAVEHCFRRSGFQPRFGVAIQGIAAGSRSYE